MGTAIASVAQAPRELRQPACEPATAMRVGFVVPAAALAIASHRVGASVSVSRHSQGAGSQVLPLARSKFRFFFSFFWRAVEAVPITVLSQGVQCVLHWLHGRSDLLKLHRRTACASLA